MPDDENNNNFDSKDQFYRIAYFSIFTSIMCLVQHIFQWVFLSLRTGTVIFSTVSDKNLDKNILSPQSETKYYKIQVRKCKCEVPIHENFFNSE